MPSSVVAAMRYNEQEELLTIVYTTGAVYAYAHVPHNVYEQMKRSGSKGTFLNKSIKGKYPFRN